MKKYIKIIISFLIGTLLITNSNFAQKDTTGKEMQFDFGITRSRNINLWPILKRTKSKDDKDLQILFPLFRNYHNFVAPSKHSHLLPIYWYDSTSAKKDFRLFSLYYPSVFRYYNDKVRDFKSFKLFEIAPQINFFELTRSADGLYVRNNMFFFIWNKYDKLNEKSYLIVFPVFWSFKNRDKSTNTFFPLFSFGKYNNRQDRYFAVTPLYWHLTTDQGYKNVLFPIWWNKSTGYGVDNRFSNVIFPFYWSFRDNNKENKVLFPILWSFKNKDYYSYTFFPVFSAGHSIDRNRNHLIITPFFWHWTNQYKTRNILFPLVWNKQSGSGDEARYSTTVFPIYWSRISYNHVRKILFPVIWSKNYENYKSFSFLPFFSEGHSTDSVYRRLMVTPFFWHFKTTNGYKNIIFPLYWNNQQGIGENAKSSTLLFPIYWSFKEKDDESKVFFPFMYTFKNKYYKSLTLLPVFSSGRSPDGLYRHLAISPVFWHFKNNDKQTNILFPIYWNKKQGTGDEARSSTVLFPIWWSGKSKEKSNVVVPPLVWSLKNPYYQSFTLMPIFSFGHSMRDSRKHLAISPVFWHFTSANGHRNILFPIYWNKKRGLGDNEETSNVVFPIYWSFKSKEINNKVIFPVSWSLKNSNYRSFTFMPLFSCGYSIDSTRKHLAISPLFWHFQSSKGHRNILFPIYWNKKRGFGESIKASNVIFPVYWSYKSKEKNNKVLFPVIWSLKNSNYQSYTLMPLFSKGNSFDSSRTHLAISPLFWHFESARGHRNILFPIYWNKKHGIADNTKTSSVVFPFYWSYKDKEKNDKVLFPVIWSLKNPVYQSFTFMPLFSKGHSNDSLKNHLAITPLFWHFKNKYEQRNFLFPFIWNKTQYFGNEIKTTNTILPVFWSYKDKLKNNKVLFPFIWSYKNPEFQSFTFLPVFSAGHNSTNTFKYLTITPLYWHLRSSTTSKNIIFPLFWNKKTGDGDTVVRSNKLLPIYWSYRNKDKSNKVLFPIIWSFKNPSVHSFTFAPIVSFGHALDTSFKYFAISPLFWHVKKPNSTRNILFPVFWNKKQSSGDWWMKSDVLFPFYWSYKSTEKNNKVLFPVIWSIKNSYSKSFTVFPLFSWGKSTDSTRRHLLLTPFFWNIHKNDTHKLGLFPVFKYYSSGYNTSKLNLFYLLYRYKRMNDEKAVSFLWPICEYKKNVDYKRFRFAPIIWYKKSRNSEYFSIQPFYYHSKDDISENYQIFWQLYTHKDIFNYRISNGILWKTIFWDKYENKDHEFRVLYLLYSNMDKDGNIEKSFLPFYHLTSEKNGNRSLAVLLSFYKKFKRQIPDTLEFYQEEKIFWFIRIRSNFKSLVDRGVIKNRRQIR